MFFFLCNCIIRVVINITAFNVLPAYLNSVVFKRAPSTSCKALKTSSDVFVADRFRVLSSFQLLMKFYSFDYILHCFLDHYVDLTDWGLVCLSEMHAKQKYSLKTQDNHNIFCPFHNQLVEISDLQITDCRIQMHRCLSPASIGGNDTPLVDKADLPTRAPKPVPVLQAYHTDSALLKCTSSLGPGGFPIQCSSHPTLAYELCQPSLDYA